MTNTYEFGTPKLEKEAVAEVKEVLADEAKGITAVQGKEAERAIYKVPQGTDLPDWKTSKEELTRRIKSLKDKALAVKVPVKPTDESKDDYSEKLQNYNQLKDKKARYTASSEEFQLLLDNILKLK